MEISGMRAIGLAVLLAFALVVPIQAHAEERVQVAQSSTIKEVQELLTKHG